MFEDPRSYRSTPSPQHAGSTAMAQPRTRLNAVDRDLELTRSPARILRRL